jgi:hypothetical protein
MPETTEKPRYAQVPIEPELMGALGMDPATAGVREIRACLEALLAITRAAAPLGLAASIQVAAAVRRYADALADARRRLARSFDRSEWNLMADVMNGSADLQDYVEHPPSAASLLLANVQDGHALDGAGYKWFGEEDPAASDRKVEALIAKLGKLSPLEADAIGWAIREFWERCDEVDHAKDDWWLPRRPARARRRP